MIRVQQFIAAVSLLLERTYMSATRARFLHGLYCLRVSLSQTMDMSQPAPATALSRSRRADASPLHDNSRGGRLVPVRVPGSSFRSRKAAAAAINNIMGAAHFDCGKQSFFQEKLTPWNLQQGASVRSMHMRLFSEPQSTLSPSTYPHLPWKHCVDRLSSWMSARIGLPGAWATADAKEARDSRPLAGWTGLEASRGVAAIAPHLSPNKYPEKWAVAFVGDSLHSSPASRKDGWHPNHPNGRCAENVQHR